MYDMGYGLGAMFSGATGGMMQGNIDKIRSRQFDRELDLRDRSVSLQDTRLEMEKANREIERGFKENRIPYEAERLFVIPEEEYQLQIKGGSKCLGSLSQ